jgi:hypothetical protein
MRTTNKAVAIIGTGALTLLASTAPAFAMRVPDTPLPSATSASTRTSADPPAATRIPISAHVSGTTPTVTKSGNHLAFHSTGSGTLRGYGHIKFDVKGNLYPSECPTFGGKETVTVLSGPAKGSQLIGRVDGYGCPQAKSAKVLDVQAVNRVSSGTGKLAGAAGGWIVTGTFNLETGALTHDLKGLVIKTG